MADLPSRADLFDAGRRFIKTEALVNPNLRITPPIADVRGSDVNLILNIGSTMGEQLSAAWARCMKGLFISTATGAALDKKVFDACGGMLRKPSNAATVDLVLARPNAGAGSGTIDAGARCTTAAGSIFSLKTDVSFGSTDIIRPAIGVAAVVGTTQNVPAGALTSWVDAPFDPTITVFNSVPAAGGTSAESDPQLKGRALTFFLTVRRGILAAIQYGATAGDPANPSNAINGVAIATAYEIVNPGTALPAGAVQLIIGDADGNASQAMVQAVIDKMLEFRCAGIPVFVSGGRVIFEPVVYDLEFLSGVDTEQAAAAVAATAAAISQFNRPGQKLLRSDLIAAARAVPGVVVNDGSLLAPLGDVVPTSNQQIIRVRQQDVSFL